ncbi:MAG: AraC family transcriptional regulator [Niabella sp.]
MADAAHSNTCSCKNALPGAAQDIIPYARLFQMNEHEIAESEANNQQVPLKYSYYEFLAKGLHFIRVLNHDGRKQERSSFKSDQPYISFVFSFSGRSLFINKAKSKVFADIRQNQNGLLFISNQVFESYWEAEAGAELYVINMTVEYFKRFLPRHHPLFETFDSSLKENTPVLLNERAIDVTPRMRSLLYDMFQCEQKDHYKHLYMKSRFIELLMLHFQEYENAYSSAEAAVSDNNLAKMYEVREIINANLTQPCTLVDLAQQVGTNECYLKKHFKQAFGTTVFGYLHKQRMERSKEILLNEDRKIAEVARLSGYKHASHFTTAFKKYFGYLPNQIKILFLSFFNSTELTYSIEMLYCVPV